MHEKLIAELEEQRDLPHYEIDSTIANGSYHNRFDDAIAALREDAGTIAELREKLNNCHDEAQARALQIISLSGELRQLRAKLAACEADKKLLYNAIKKHKDELYELYSKPTVPEHIPMAEVLNIELHGALAALEEGI